jgi:hypothetical protein
MDEKYLLKIALLTAFGGLSALFLIMYLADIPEKNIGDIQLSDAGKNIKIIGIVKSVRYSPDNSTTFVKLSQECTVDVVSFDKVVIAQDAHITVEGRISEYNGQIEIIADSIIQRDT